MQKLDGVFIERFSESYVYFPSIPQITSVKYRKYAENLICVCIATEETKKMKCAPLAF